MKIEQLEKLVRLTSGTSKPDELILRKILNKKDEEIDAILCYLETFSDKAMGYHSDCIEYMIDYISDLFNYFEDDIVLRNKAMEDVYSIVSNSVYLDSTSKTRSYLDFYKESSYNHNYGRVLASRTFNFYPLTEIKKFISLFEEKNAFDEVDELTKSRLSDEIEEIVSNNFYNGDYTIMLSRSRSHFQAVHQITIYRNLLESVEDDELEDKEEIKKGLELIMKNEDLLNKRSMKCQIDLMRLYKENPKKSVLDLILDKVIIEHRDTDEQLELISLLDKEQDDLEVSKLISKLVSYDFDIDSIKDVVTLYKKNPDFDVNKYIEEISGEVKYDDLLGTINSNIPLGDLLDDSSVPEVLSLLKKKKINVFNSDTKIKKEDE